MIPHLGAASVTAALPKARLRLLLAEDEPLQQKVLQRVLTIAGYDVYTASHGDEAFDRLQREAFHILVTDWDMPGMDGATLCRRLREAPRSGYLYILMLTGHSATADLVAALEAGADDYIRKPPEVPELLARVNAGRRIIELERSLSAAHEKIQRLSITDPLLDIFNRRYLDEKLPEEIARALRYGRPLAVLMADIDHFKTVNDELGHQAGDQVLRAFAAQMRASIRQSIDWIARYGGEEFVLVLPETTVEAAACVAEKIRRECEEGALPECPCVVTASFGVAGLMTAGPGANICADGLLRAADAALYRSKRGGRNRVSLAESML
jgi:two-component system, cell cycle response regulator